MTEKPVWCRRYLENMSILGGSVVVTGWAFGEDAGALKRVDAETRPVETGRFQSVEVFSSPDVADAFPKFAPASKCRFRLMLSIEFRNTLPSFLAMLRPVFEGGGGRTWCIGHDLLSPPKEFIERVGGGADVGLEFLEYFIDVGRLSENDTVLDLGCGTGRMAIPLQKFLSATGRYLGIDVDARLIGWCQENIQKNDRRFEFLHVPARNDFYNPNGHLEVEKTAIAAQTESVSFAFATSVFTHLRAAHAEHYLRELGRTIRSGGRLLITAFLVSSSSDKRDVELTAALKFQMLDSETWTTDPALPETAIGFRIETLNRWASAGGLTLVRTLHGTWHGGHDGGGYQGGDDGNSYQDILVYSKR